MDFVYILYGYVGIICAGVIGIILNRTKATAYKNTVDKTFCNVLIFFIIFTFFDALWGIVGAFVASSSPALYEASTYIFHILSATSSVVGSMYAVHFIRIQKKLKNGIFIYRICLFALQLGLIATNIVMNRFLGKEFWFIIDEAGVYHTQSQTVRYIVFTLQFLQFMPIAIYSFIYALVLKKNKRIFSRYLSGAFFLVILFIFGILQMLYPDGPFYSLGFMVFAVSIYSINVTKQREDYLEDYHKIEEAKKSQEEIQKALNVAKEANAVKEKFLANMSHDIRTPINGIMGLVELSKKEEDVNKLKDYLSKIDSTSHHLLSLVNDVLDMTLIENKQDKLLNLEPIDILILVDNCSSIISSQVMNKNFDFILDVDNNAKNHYVFGDELRIKQILINILGNAIKFTDEGYVKFSVKEISNTANFVKYEFKVEDTGIGMTKEFMEHIFEPFSQENSGGRTNYAGTGLGMSITKQLVEFMEGTIKVESEVNKGSTFEVVIPFKKAESLKRETLEEEKDVDISGIKCLLVEDNELNMEIAKTILESLGAVITEAKNGQEAVDIFEKEPAKSFDVILMDIMMPVLNGYEATKKIRSSSKEDAKQIPIIAMTANAFDEDKKQAVLAGMNGHISKPINFDALKKKIKKVLNQ